MNDEHRVRKIGGIKIYEPKLEELEESLSNLYIQKATKQLNNPKQILQDRKDIARIKTIMREQELQKEKEKVKKE